MISRGGLPPLSSFGDGLLDFVREAQATGAWLGVLEGPRFWVISAWRASKLSGATLDAAQDRLLGKLLHAKQPIVCRRTDPDWRVLANPVHKADTYWLGIPLLNRSKLVGAVGLWGRRSLAPANMRRLRLLAERLAPELACYAELHDLAAELDQAAGTDPDSPKVDLEWSDGPSLARHVLRRLGRALPKATVTLSIPDWQQPTYHRFRLSAGRITSVDSATMFDGPPVELRKRPLRNRSARDTGAKPTPSRASIRLALGNGDEGMLLVEGRGADLSPACIELIGGPIAGSLGELLAGLRRWHAADLRARKLGLITSVSLELAGLTEVRQIVEAAAGRISQLFEGGLTRIVLTDGGTTALMAATAGSVGAENVVAKPPDAAEVDRVLSAQVSRTGRSLLIRGREAWEALAVESRGFAGSAVCAALKDETRILGTIEVRHDPPKAVGADDLDALECIAAVVASALVFARRQETSGSEPSAPAKRPQRIPEDRLIRAARLISVGEMAAGIAHELNNPLTTVAGFTELILDEIPPDAAYRADVEMVLQEARRARGVVRRLLDFARQGEGVRSRADIAEILDDVLGLTMHLMRTNGVRLEFVRSENLPWVLVNSNQLKQVFLNLIHNALQAMPAGGNLGVRMEPRTESGRDWIVVRISDDGLGIRPGDMSRLFEPFFTTRAEHGGTGLGLSVSYGIVSEHGGKIDVESQLGHGSTFSVWLPV